MKKILFFAVAILIISGAVRSQSHYWVMLTDKAGTTFDPYSYFDAKAIERYRLNNADLYDISNYPLDESYVYQIDALVSDDFGQSRWLNAVAVTATPEQIAAVMELPFVKEVVALCGDMQTAGNGSVSDDKMEENDMRELENSLKEQLIRMGGSAFRAKGINGRGVRIAVFDGGFPQVNTHIAFKHLREEGRIVKTWNFPDKKENVYGWNSHGLMTLSCIAGIHRYEGSDGEVTVDMGLATGAEYLLARTEIEAEPFKEEVWWQMAVEWADKNGAQIISSSLGYGKDRYYTKDMNGQSYVAKAGNMAARKGMLVCNSAGNEGTDRSWRTIITPSDADSVLCVGGITHSLTNYEHISFSSYGPSADGRMKPNVVAFGHAYTANTGKGDNKFHYVDGTSFSCPLVAGFAACALQARPELTAMQLFHEIEKSADLYPYCDYTFGYGVPQAAYFVGKGTKELKNGLDVAPKPTFRFEEDAESGKLRVIPLQDNGNCRLFIKNTVADGQITDYYKYELGEFNTDSWLEVSAGNTVTVHFNGYTKSYDFNTPEDNDGVLVAAFKNKDGDYDKNVTKLTDGSNGTDIRESNWRNERYLMLGLPISTRADVLDHSFWSPAKRIGLRKTYYFGKAYGWGAAIEYGYTSLRFGDEVNRLDSLTGMDDNVRWLDKKVTKHRLNLGEVGIELYQRVRLRPCGIFSKGWHWDLGVYGNWSYNVYKLNGRHTGDIAGSRGQSIRNMELLSDYRWNWGVTTRLTRDWVGIYARYRLNDLGKEVPVGQFILPQLEVGLQLAF